MNERCQVLLAELFVDMRALVADEDFRCDEVLRTRYEVAMWVCERLVGTTTRRLVTPQTESP